MVSLVYVALPVAAWLMYSLISNLLGLKKNIAMAKESGLPYVVVPVYGFNTLWMAFSKPFTDWVKTLPESYRPNWVKHVTMDLAWEQLSSQYDSFDTRTYLVVCPTAIIGWTANAEAIVQITTRRNDYPKPTHIYRALDIYGKNIVSTESHHWRRQRKVASPSFSEKNNHMVWAESLKQADSMLKDWTGMDGNQIRTIGTVAHDCMRLSLHIISKAGFGIRLLWPGVEVDDGTATKGLKGDHTLTYTEALEGLLDHLLLVISLPMNLLRRLPFKKTQKAYECYTEWDKYMDELMNEKKVELSSGEVDQGMDLMGALVKSAGYGAGSKTAKGKDDYLTDQEIRANAFVFILAGHETTANVLHFAFILLAMEPSEQRKLQKDIESIFEGKPVSEWDYETYLPQLFGGMVGAVLNETLRLIPPALNIPKFTHEWQTLNIDGKQYKMPPQTMLNITASAVHRDPRYWPAGPPVPREEAWHPTSNQNDDLNEFRPTRWILNDTQKQNSGAMPSRDTENKDAEDVGVNTASDTSESLFKPVKGAYIPFSEGFRSCIGRRFAQVEVLAVLARIFSEYSVEFAVDKYASDEEVARMSEDEKKKIWSKVRHEAREALRTQMGTIITIQLRGGAYVPLRFVRKGTERFNF